jgi:hypothetical protein
VDRVSGFRVTRRLIPVALCRGLLGPIAPGYVELNEDQLSLGHLGGTCHSTGPSSTTRAHAVPVRWVAAGCAATKNCAGVG